MATVAEFLMERMENAGIKHVFGLPGDYILDFYDLLWKNPKIDVINTSDESGAGFAADAYARSAGIGCVCVTYNVGALKIANAVACAYAERSPVVVISGSPGMNERKESMLLHHMVRSFECQKEVFQKITCASAVLDDPTKAGYEIDKVFEALKHHKQPVYIELPRDVAKKALTYDVYKQGTPSSPKSDPENIQEALGESIEWLNNAKNPVIMAGVQVSRFGFGAKVTKFAEKHNLPITTTLLSKSVINERHPLFAGVYMGDASNEFTRKLVDESDCLLMLGVLKTDMCVCFKPSVFPKKQVISCNVEGLKIRNHTYTDIQFSDFCNLILDSKIAIREKPILPAPRTKEFVPTNNKIKATRFFDKINSILDKNMALIADIGDALFGASDITVHHTNNFLSPAFYTTMGFAIPGALGFQVASKIRPIVLVGDGAFQMSFAELSTIISRKLNPLIFVLNNRGYTTERYLKDGGFNDIRDWNYHRINEIFNGGNGVKVETEMELERAVQEGLDSKELFVINTILGQKDISDGLARMTSALSRRV